MDAPLSGGPHPGPELTAPDPAVPESRIRGRGTARANRARGTPGGNFTPLIANIFLHYVLDLWFETKIKPHVHGVCQLVRYANDFPGFTHYGGRSRKGNWMLCRQTSAKKSRKALSAWLRVTRNTAELSPWWPILQAKLAGHYQYYGISGNARVIARFHHVAKRLVFKWLNRRSQKASFTWERFQDYLEHYPLPEPRIRHRRYTRSTVS